jgi:hypothetical protein
MKRRRWWWKTSNVEECRASRVTTSSPEGNVLTATPHTVISGLITTGAKEISVEITSRNRIFA